MFTNYCCDPNLVKKYSHNTIDYIVVYKKNEEAYILIYLFIMLLTSSETNSSYFFSFKAEFCFSFDKMSFHAKNVADMARVAAANAGNIARGNAIAAAIDDSYVMETLDRICVAANHAWNTMDNNTNPSAYYLSRACYAFACNAHATGNPVDMAVSRRVENIIGTAFFDYCNR